MISLLVAIAKNNVIGKDNRLPWHYPEDLHYFKKLTTGHTVLMGMNTFQSILCTNHQPLPDRNNLVVTRKPDFVYPGIIVIHDLEAFLKEKHDEEIFVIGGKQIFDAALPYANRLYITHIAKEYAGDTYFPAVDYAKYRLISETKRGELNFSVYERIPSCCCL